MLLKKIVIIKLIIQRRWFFSLIFNILFMNSTIKRVRNWTQKYTKYNRKSRLFRSFESYRQSFYYFRLRVWNKELKHFFTNQLDLTLSLSQFNNYNHDFFWILNLCSEVGLGVNCSFFDMYRFNKKRKMQSRIYLIFYYLRFSL